MRWLEHHLVETHGHMLPDALDRARFALDAFVGDAKGQYFAVRDAEGVCTCPACGRQFRLAPVLTELIVQGLSGDSREPRVGAPG